MRVVALDLGVRRVGVAASDPSGTIAVPRAVLTRSGDEAADRAAVVEAVREEGAELVVVGLPVSMDGRERAAAVAARKEAEALGGLLEIPIEIQDERLSTVLATRLRREAASDGTATRGGRSSAARRRRRSTRRPVDAEAAAVILQSWLDAHRADA